MGNDSKFYKVPEEELREYVEASAQLPGESEDDWARRVRNLEEDLIRAHKDDPEPTSVEDDPLSSIDPERGSGSGEGPNQ